MSPEMKAILLSLKKLPFKTKACNDVEVFDSLDGEQKFVHFSIPKERFQSCSSSSFRNKVFFPWMSENDSKCNQLENINSTMANEKGKVTGGATCNQSNGAIFHRRRSWVVSKHILARSNTVDCLRLQTFDDNDCKERLKVCSTGAQQISTPQSPSMAETNLSLEGKITPKSVSAVSNKPLCRRPFLNHRPQYLSRTKTGPVCIKSCNADINREREAVKTDNVWENMSKERKLFINKWLAPKDR